MAKALASWLVHFRRHDQRACRGLSTLGHVSKANFSLEAPLRGLALLFPCSKLRTSLSVADTNDAGDGCDLVLASGLARHRRPVCLVLSHLAGTVSASFRPPVYLFESVAYAIRNGIGMLTLYALSHTFQTSIFFLPNDSGPFGPHLCRR